MYLPWSDLDLVDLRKVTPLPQEFEDPAGLIRLSDKQRARLKGWVRPYDICDNPHMVHLISSFTIKQVQCTRSYKVVLMYRAQEVIEEHFSLSSLSLLVTEVSDLVFSSQHSYIVCMYTPGVFI